MCKVYNTVGCLTAIKSHLRQHHIDEYKSVKELISFQNTYSDERQQIISNHKFLIELERDTLSDQIMRLDDSIKEKKDAVEQQLRLEVEDLKHRLANSRSTHSNFFTTLINYCKEITIKLKILNNELTFNFKVANSIKHLSNDLNVKNERYQYIASYFDDAVQHSGSLQLQEHDRKKRVIDEINSSIYGAIGEQKVVKELGKLSNDHILINDLNCRFHPSIYNRKENDHIYSIQVDHLLVSPAGVFIIETKNWSQNSVNNLNLFSPLQQITRANFALHTILHQHISQRRLLLNKHHWGDRTIPLRNLIVLINNKPREEFQYMKILNLNELIGYVSYFKPCFTKDEIETIADYLRDLNTY